MSRMGDTIRKSRIKYGLTEKQLAKKTGLAESFIKEVELGRKIPSDDQAKRMLKACGFTEDMSTEIDTANEPEVQLRPKPRPYILPVEENPTPKQVEETHASNDAWLDALGGVVKRVPVTDGAGVVIDHVLEPVIGGKIQGGAPDKVQYFRAQDESLAGFGIHAGDLLLTVPEKQPVDDSFMLFNLKGGRRAVRKVKKLEGSKLCLQSYDRELKIETVMWGEVTIIGRCVKMVRSL